MSDILDSLYSTDKPDSNSKSKSRGKKHKRSNSKTSADEDTTSNKSNIVKKALHRFVAVCENIVFLMFIGVLTMSLVIGTIVFSVASAVLDATAALSLGSGTGTNIDLPIEGGGSTATDYSSYDWKGNMTTNLLKLKTNVQRNLYKCITMAFELEDMTSDTSRFYTSADPYYLVAAGILEGENCNYFTNRDNTEYNNANDYIQYTAESEVRNATLDVTRHLRYDVWGNLAEWLFDQGKELTEYTDLVKWNEYSPETYNGECGTCLVPDDTTVRGMQILAQHYMPYTMHMMAYKFSFKTGDNLSLYGGTCYRVYEDVGGSSVTIRTDGTDLSSIDTIKAKLEEYGIEPTDEHVADIVRQYSYTGHWSGYLTDLDRQAALEVAVAAYAEANCDITNWHMSGINVSNCGLCGRYPYIGGNSASDIRGGTNGGGILEMTDSAGQTLEDNELYLCINGNKLVDSNGKPMSMVNYLYNKYSKTHTGWSSVVSALKGASDDGGGSATESFLNTYLSTGVTINGYSLVKYIADLCGIVIGGNSTAFLADTVLGSALVTTAEKLYSEHNGEGSATGNIWVTDSNEPAIHFGGLGLDWCAYTVNYFLDKTMVGNSGKSIREVFYSMPQDNSNKFPGCSSADLGYYADGNGGLNKIFQGVECDITENWGNGYVKLHYTGHSIVAQTTACTMTSTPMTYMYDRASGTGVIKKEVKGGYIPKAGDFITFTNRGNEGSKCRYSHVGLVTGVEGDMVYTIEGNTWTGTSASVLGSDVYTLCKCSYDISDERISFYFEVDYDGLLKDYGD